MSIGETLAEARNRIGLTVTEVSERTRVRQTIIRDIERDDFSSCGADFYARGHIRAIARVVGIDPAPLIEQYDQAHNWQPGADLLDPGTPTDVQELDSTADMLPSCRLPRPPRRPSARAALARVTTRSSPVRR